MRDNPEHLINELYLNNREDQTQLFRTILSLAVEIGWENGLSILEACSIRKRLAWVQANLMSYPRTDNPVVDGFKLFYGTYLGVSVPLDGVLVDVQPDRLVSRWWNECPTLNACEELGLDTCEICRKAFHRPVQVFLEALDPRLRFERNYDALRPHTPYCEEIIWLDRG